MFASISLLLLAAAAAAQEGKPTRAQTIEYLHAGYPKSISYGASRNLSGNEFLLFRGEIQDLSLSIAGSQVTASYVDLLKRSYLKESESESEKSEERTQHIIVFDLKDIETIGGTMQGWVGEIPWEEAQIGAYPVYLVFKTANGKEAVTATSNGEPHKMAEARIPLAVESRGENHQALRELHNGQLYKAFEHLRKLSGAPEPLRF